MVLNTPLSYRDFSVEYYAKNETRALPNSEVQLTAAVTNSSLRA